MNNRSITTKDIALLHQLYKGQQLRLRPEFQRLSVWPKAAKAYLIDTILNDRPMPLFFFQRTMSAQSGRQMFDVIEGLSWRKATLDGRPFPPHIEASCVDALAALRMNTARKLKKAIRHARFKAHLRRFAQIANVAPDEVSHLAIVLLLVLTFAPAKLMDLFPIEACDSAEFREMRRSD